MGDANLKVLWNFCLFVGPLILAALAFLDEFATKVPWFSQLKSLIWKIIFVVFGSLLVTLGTCGNEAIGDTEIKNKELKNDTLRIRVDSLLGVVESSRNNFEDFRRTDSINYEKLFGSMKDIGSSISSQKEPLPTLSTIPSGSGQEPFSIEVKNDSAFLVWRFESTMAPSHHVSLGWYIFNSSYPLRLIKSTTGQGDFLYKPQIIPGLARFTTLRTFFPGKLIDLPDTISVLCTGVYSNTYDRQREIPFWDQRTYVISQRKLIPNKVGYNLLFKYLVDQRIRIPSY